MIDFDSLLFISELIDRKDPLVLYQVIPKADNLLSIGAYLF